MGRLLGTFAAILFSSLLLVQTDAFAPASSSLARHLPTPSITTIELSAKRRRRKDAPKPSSSSDDLPDFDINEEENVIPAATSSTVQSITTQKQPPKPKLPKSTSSNNPTPIKRGTGLNKQLATDLGGNVDGLDEDVILSAMRGQGEAWMPPTSIEDTLRDRSLEKYMDFDRQIAQDGGGEATIVDLPTMEEVINRRRRREAEEAVKEGRIEEAAMLIDTEGMGKKAAKRAERKAAALQRDAEESQGGGFDLEGLNVLKLLENGAWVGIGLLVVWEIYINSPFFERAAPLIPAVFD